MRSGRPSQAVRAGGCYVRTSATAAIQRATVTPHETQGAVRETNPAPAKIGGETITRAGSIEASSVPHGWASENIAVVHVTSQQNVFRAVRQLNAVMTMPMDEITAADMVAWTKGQKGMLFRHESTLLEGTVGNITRIAQTALPEKEEEQPTGILVGYGGSGNDARCPP